MKAQYIILPSQGSIAFVSVLFLVHCFTFYNDKHSRRRRIQRKQTREEYKEARFQKMIPHLRMKRTMYNNISMLSSEGSLLSVISSKKALWYVSRDLAIWTDEKTIKLSFQAGGTPPPFARGEKKNACVKCGSTESGYMRHFIVPKCYRLLFPSNRKKHNSHDIVILCPICEREASRLTDKRMKILDCSFRDQRVKSRIIDKKMQLVRSLANGLLNHRHKIPPESIISHERKILDYCQKNCIGNEMSNELLLHCAKGDKFGEPNPLYVQHADLVYANVCRNEDELTTFILNWRRWFVEDVRPKFMPQGWDISNRTISR